MADQFFGLTDTGKARQNNEDTFIAQQSANGKFIIACVIDGLGGYSGGEIAAAIARETILQRLDKPSGEVIPMIVDCFNLANKKILQEKQKVNHDQMACVATLAVIDLVHNQFHYAHIGDTRLYLLRDHSLVKISHDQSFVGFLEDSGRLSEEEAMNHPKRNEINKALGFDTQLDKDDDYIETGQSPFLPGDMLLLCSDGLTDMIGKEEIINIITSSSSLKDKCHQLIDAANKRGGRDNITAVLVQNNKTPLKHDATMPAVNVKTNDDADSNANVKNQSLLLGEESSSTAPKGNKTAILILSLLVLIFLSTNILQFIRNRTDSTAPEQKQIAVSPAKTRNKQELKLQNAINHLKGNILLLSDTAYTTPLLISHAIEINKDSLTIKTQGKIELQSDYGYNGAAFNLSTQCKNILLDSLSFTNFQTAIVAFNSTIALKNTRFIKCGIPIQNAFQFADKKYISGKINNSLFKTDSLPVTNK